jgi:hypothetical protein
MLMSRERFNKILLEAVDFTFDSLGESCNQALYFHLETSFHVRREEIPNKTRFFDRALKLIFKSGSVFLEKLILKKMCEELNVEFEGKETFDYVEAIAKITSTVLDENELPSLIVAEKTSVRRRENGHT